MRGQEILDAMGLPPASRVDRRVPKSLLLEHGAPTASDKRRIRDGIGQLQWVAAMKPTTVGVAEYRDGVREYLEIAVLHLRLRSEARTARLVELLHRAVPYPVVAVTEGEDLTHLSFAHKRWSQGEAGSTVLDGGILAADWPHGLQDAHDTAFLAAIALDRQPRSSLFVLYQGLMDAVLAHRVARLTGRFSLADSPEHVEARRTDLSECERLAKEISRLRAAARREKQVPRQVELNLELKRLEAARARTLEHLSETTPR